MQSSIHKYLSAALLAASLWLTGTTYAADNTPAPPVNVIFDTDIWSDIDDMLALAMLHALHDRHEINLIAVTVSTDNPWCAPYVDLLDTFYGHPQIPVGVVHDGLSVSAFQEKFPKLHWPPTIYTQLIAEKKKADGTPLYPHRLLNGRDAPEAVGLLRKALAAQPDGSVAMVQVGYSTNLARLLDSKADISSALEGRELVKRKVKLLSVMAGNYAEGRTFPKGAPEFNVMADVPAAKKLFAQWPTPVVASGFEIGLALPYPEYSIEHDYTYVPHHPIADTYRTYVDEQKARRPHNHPTFDLTSVLYAARSDREYFSLSKPGKIIVLDDGGTRFEESPQGLHRYLMLTETQKARVLEALQMLASQPPMQR